jgi:hypothetical protein
MKNQVQEYSFKVRKGVPDQVGTGEDLKRREKGREGRLSQPNSIR